MNIDFLWGLLYGIVIGVGLMIVYIKFILMEVKE